ncbi:uncharacterized protein LOC115681898 [Syzygium oleosum]|uniref:uncharacterized protein LOC115681898 n=1 Tax=Syzygium oleosum TaxID=219896 RepID=UPI0024BB54BA|nr:uncharacterized protein LOC115681898 [Syzygium oleosum]
MAGAFLTSVASKLVSSLGEYLIAPIGRQFGYVLCYKSYVEDLKDRLNELKNARKRVQQSVTEAERDIKPIHTDVKDWLEKVEEKIKEAEIQLKSGENAKDACFRGWIPNPMVHHPIGRKVKKMTQVIQGLHEKSQNSNFQEVYHESTPIGIVTATMSAARSVDKNDVLESRASIIEAVMKALANDKVCVIGVHGIGGVGKSKLLEDIEWRVKEEKLFDVVATANVSRNSDLKRIQGEIAYALGLKIMNEETARGRADRLCKRLESDSKKNILIILDNLWEKLELKEVGIPCGVDNKVKGCKLLLTSRYKNVLRIDMGSDEQIQLDQLKPEEAGRLFERIVGENVNDPEFKPLVDGVVENCKGLPLQIVSLAKRLRNADLAAWRNALAKGSDVKSMVELYYNDLKDERIQSLFMVCAIHSGRISMNASLIYCMGLGLYKSFSKTIEIARDALITDLHSLQDSSLLLDSDDMEWFRMHDIFADEAISIASTQWNALVGKKDGFKVWSKDELKKCTAISFPYVGIDELPERLDCPNLRMLLLLENNPSLKIPDLFLESMEKLQVLDFTGLSFTSLPSSIRFLENLKSLCLDFCYLEDVTVLGKLKGLQFLSFIESTIARLPKEIGELTELRFLDLTRCARLKVIEPGVLGRLVNLEELYMADSFDQWEVEDEAPRRNASLAELKNMNKLSTLHIAIPHSTYLSGDLPFVKLNKHIIQIGNVWDWSGEHKESRTLKLKLEPDNLLSEYWVQRCLRRTQDLHLYGLQDGDNSIPNLCIEGFKDLKHLHVQNSPSLQYVVPSAEIVQCTAFSKLESLFLENLNNLEKICCDCLAPESFSQLKIVKLDNCGEIKHLFRLSMMRVFLQLEEIELSKCHSMQQFVAYDEADEIRNAVEDDPKVKSCNLHRLTLRNLSEMTSFCKTMDHPVAFFGQQVTELQNLEAITVKRCQSIQEIFNLEGLTANGDVEILSRLAKLTISDLPSLGRILNKNPRRALCFRNLRALKVQNCGNLRFLFSFSMVEALEQIKEIQIANCKLMEEIMDVQEEESEKAAITNIIGFPLLTSLSLEELPNLKTFSYGKYHIHCPSLTRLTISGCPKMMTFSSIEEKQRPMAGDTDLQQMFGCIDPGSSSPDFFGQNILFPRLEELTLLSLHGLRRIWHNELPEESFCRLASITVRDCENLSHIFPSTLIERFQSLKMIEAVKCTSLEALIEHVPFNTNKSQKCLLLLDLKRLKLWHLPRLIAVGTSSTKATWPFPNLTNVSLCCCHSLTYLLTNNAARTLNKLKMLDVSGCNNMQEVVAVEEGEERNLQAVKFSHLRSLKLWSLKSLIRFSLGRCSYDGPYSLFDEKVTFPKLEELRLIGIQSRELWENEMSSGSICCLKVLEVKRCHNLLNVIPSSVWKRLLHCMESLTVENCPRLRNLFTMSMAKSLRQLHYLSLGGCEEMEYVVAREEEKPNEATDIIVIPQLVTLYLHNMPKLKSFCQGKYISEWPSLKEFTVEDCKAVEVILGDANCRKLESGAPKQPSLLLVEKVEFPSLELMKISHMDNMEKIWLDELASNAFSKLKTLVVEYCEKFSSIFSSATILERFQNLEKLIVTNCDSLEAIFCIQEFNFGKAHFTGNFQLRELVLRQLPKMKHVWSGLPQGALSFGHLRCLEAFKCESLKILFPSSVAKSMTHLEELVVWDCGVEEILVEEDRGVETNVGDPYFPRLTAVTFFDLSELRSFYINSHTSAWPLLKELRVRHCSKMRSFSFTSEIQSCQGIAINHNQPALFSLQKVIPQLERWTLTREDVVMMQHDILGNLRELALGCYHDENVAFPSDFFLQRFPNLEELRVTCSCFEEIFPEEALGPGALGNLKQLWLTDLCNLKRVWRDGSLMAEILKHIESLFIRGCPGLSIVFPCPASFQSLRELEVWDCSGLVHMGTCSAVTSLVHLTRLTLRDCGAMKDVVTDEDDDRTGGEEIFFRKLEELILRGLPSLESFSPADCAFMFPSLARTTVTECPKMNIFCKGTARTPKLDKLLLSDEDDEGRWEGELNTTIRSLST